MAVGGPALCYYVSPTEAELFLKYNPELQKRSLENRYQKQQDFDDFVGRLKEYSKSDKPIWAVVSEAEKMARDGKIMGMLCRCALLCWTFGVGAWGCFEKGAQNRFALFFEERESIGMALEEARGLELSPGAPVSHLLLLLSFPFDILLPAHLFQLRVLVFH